MPEIIEGNIGELSTLIDAIMDSVEQDFIDTDYEELLEQFMDDLEDQHAGYFEGEIGPDDAAWKPLSPVTVAMKGHDRILWLTGALAASVSQRGEGAIREVAKTADGLDMTFGTSIEYAGRHQDGDGVPQRQMVGTDEAGVELWSEEIAAYAVEGLRSG